jgi:hypothetical protein
MSHVAVLMLCMLGFTALAAVMERHQEDLFGRSMVPATARTLRLVGWAALLLALAVAVRAQGWALGLVSYSGHTSLSAALVFGLLIVQARQKNRR